MIVWLKQSNRWKHLLGGLLIGAFANSIYCAAYGTIGVASALELKDYLWEKKWDWIDWLLTVLGGAVGYLLRIGLLLLL